MPKIKKGEKKQAAPPLEPAPQRIEERIEESKYFVAPQGQPRKGEFDFPYNYGDTRIVLLVRDPHWLHAYWEVNEARRLILRVHDATSEPWKSFDIDVLHGARNWYINVPRANRTYVVDIGYLAPDGRFAPLARSNAVTTPRDGMSEVIDEEWMTIDFERIYALSGGFGIGKSSGEIKKLMEKHLMMMKSSGWVTSPGSSFRPRPR